MRAISSWPAHADRFGVANKRSSGSRRRADQRVTVPKSARWTTPTPRIGGKVGTAKTSITAESRGQALTCENVVELRRSPPLG